MDKEDSNKKEQIRPAKVPLLPPTSISREELIPQLTAAHAAIGELRGFLGGLKNPDLLIAPFRKREAVASSAIEGTRATLDEVMEYEAVDEAKTEESPRVSSKAQDIEEIINYEHAMGVALKELKSRPIGETLLKRTHRTLLTSVRGSTKIPGEFRRAPVAVGQYVPPAYADIPALMTNWENYLNSKDIESDPLIRVGVAHYQFEAIHPFLDGNGRIGRLVIPLAMCQEGILQTPVLYISHYLEQYKVEYQRLLHEVDTDQRWTEWLKFFLKAVEEQAKITTAMAKEIQDLYERLKIEILGKGTVTGKIRSQYAIQILDLIFEKPVITAAHVQEIINARSNATAYNLIDKFVAAGILRLLFTSTRGKYYGFTELRKIIRS